MGKRWGHGAMDTDVQHIYSRMGDSLSREIYHDRLQYSATRDFYYIEHIVDATVRSSPRWERLCALLKKTAVHSQMYLFGAGKWGNILFRETSRSVPWKAVIDSAPAGKTVGDLPVVQPQALAGCECREMSVVISSYKNGHEMRKLLQKTGIPQDRIIDAGTVIHQLTEGAIYFDLEQLKPMESDEVFVDAGCFDGLTTQAFFQWCRGNGYAYCFEPDKGNAAVVQRNLVEWLNRYELAEKALWSKTADLCIDARGDCASSVRENGGLDGNNRAAAVALDEYLGKKRVTYIKMDVEGAEAEVLEGAKNTIAAQHPRLAVSIYHKADDIYVLPEMILRYHPGYRFYLRHYSFLDYDTVLYAVP